MDLEVLLPWLRSKRFKWRVCFMQWEPHWWRWYSCNVKKYTWHFEKLPRRISVLRTRRECIGRNIGCIGWFKRSDGIIKAANKHNRIDKPVRTSRNKRISSWNSRRNYWWYRGSGCWISGLDNDHTERKFLIINKRFQRKLWNLDQRTWVIASWVCWSNLEIDRKFSYEFIERGCWTNQ